MARQINNLQPRVLVPEPVVNNPVRDRRIPRGRTHNDPTSGVASPVLTTATRGLRTCEAVFPLSCPLVNLEPVSMGLVNQAGEMAVPVGQHVPIEAALGALGTTQKGPDLASDDHLPRGLHRSVVPAGDEFGYAWRGARLLPARSRGPTSKPTT
jgi:hypothetical protein